MTGPPARSIAVRWIAAALIGLFAFDNILLWAFLGKLTPLAAIAGGGCVLLLLTLLIREPACRDAVERITVPTLTVCFGIAAGLLILGGEGRFLYANFDWQVRDAVLADIGRNRWPFAYAFGDAPHLLRAPVGMFLIPALIGGASQVARDVGLLAANSVMLGLLFALGSSLFDRRSRWIALIVFTLFSGLDIIGTQIVASSGGYPSFDHLERWMPAMQYSSAITQIFWVPQHAIAGWSAAVLFLLWRTHRLGAGFFISVIPLSTLWSPLALLGMIPFALFAGFSFLRARTVTPALICVAAVSILIATPAFLYLMADAAMVGSGFQALPILHYLLFILLEFGVYLALVWLRRAPLDTATFAIVAGCLLIMPLYRIGDGEDFMMRASIMPLALLAYFMARTVCVADAQSRHRMAAALVLAVGAVTGAKEVARSIVHHPAPPPRCSLVDVWNRQGERISPIGFYVVHVEALPALVRPASPSLISGSPDGKPCWDHPWVVAR